MRRFPKFIFFFLVLLFFFTINLNSKEIKTLARINNHSITNYDLFREIEILEKIKNIKIRSNQKIIILNKLIDLKIKELEVKNNNINVDDIELDKKLNELSYYKNSPEEIKKYIKKEYQINLQWNKLINFKFRNKLEINMDEVNMIISSKKKLKEEDVIKISREKKIQLISNNFFNQIKKDYLIKIYL